MPKTIKQVLARLDGYYHDSLSDEEVFVVNPDLQKALAQTQRLIQECAPPRADGGTEFASGWNHCQAEYTNNLKEIMK